MKRWASILVAAIVLIGIVGVLPRIVSTPEPDPAASTTEPQDETSIAASAVANWIRVDTGSVIDGGRFSAGKTVAAKETLRGNPAPSRFTVYQVFDSLLDQTLQRPELVAVTELSLQAQDRDTALSQDWDLPASDLLPYWSDFIYEDDLGRTSGAIQSALIATVSNTFSRVVGSVTLEVGFDVTFAVDPEVVIVPLVPWSETFGLTAYVDQYAAEAQADPEPFFNEYEAFLPDERPTEWTFEFSGERVEAIPPVDIEEFGIEFVDPPEAAAVLEAQEGEVIALQLTIHAQSDDQLLFALAVYDVTGELVAASDLIDLGR